MTHIFKKIHHVLVITLLLLSLTACSLPSFTKEKEEEVIEYDTEAMAREVLALENEYRLENGLNELTWDDDLAYVASIRAVEIVEKWDHQRPDGTKYVAILDEIEYPSTLVGENLGKLQTSAESVMEQWKESPGHNANLLGDFNKLGVYVHQAENGKLYWVQIFAQ